MLPRFVTAAAVLLSLVAAAPAAADSIAYVSNGDVWLASPDGSRKQQVTRTGGYAYVSQADDGTMIALAPRERLHRLSRTGQVLADFATYVSDGAPVSGGVNQFHGPFEPQISPDGTKVAFEWFNDTFTDAPGCNTQTVPPCSVYRQSQGVGISSATGYTSPEAYGLLTGWIYPHWMSEDTLLRSFGGAVLTDDAVFTHLGDNEIDPWFFDDQQGFGVNDVELSRDLQTVVGIAGLYDEKLRVYRTTMHPFGAPNWNHQPFVTGNVPVAERCYELPGKFRSTSLAPDGRGLAYGTAEGIWVTSIPEGCAPGGPGTLMLPGARSPDWGPADIPPASAYEGTPGTEQPGPSGGGTAKLTLRAVRGGKITVTVPGPGKVSVTAKRGRRTLGSAKATAKRAGAVTLKLGSRARGKATVRATFKPTSGKALTASRSLTLRK